MDHAEPNPPAIEPVSGAAVPEEDVPAELVDSESHKNTKSAYCKVCHCKILDVQSATLVHKETFLLYDKKSQTQPDAGETLTHFWELSDMFQFANIAFSMTVDNKKYLTCADCEKEIVGIHYVGDPKCYLSHSRVVYE